MRKTIICFAVLAVAFIGVFAQESGIPDLTSPDGRLVVSFNLTGTENPTYSVKYDGKQMLEDSPIGIMLDMGSKPTLEGLPQGREAGNGDFTKNLSLVECKTESAQVDYTMDRIKTAHVNHAYNVAVIGLRNAANQNIEFEFRVSDNDIAIRYIYYKKHHHNNCPCKKSQKHLACVLIFLRIVHVIFSDRPSAAIAETA